LLGDFKMQINDNHLNIILTALKVYHDESAGAGLDVLVDLIESNKNQVADYWLKKLPDLKSELVYYADYYL